jgi:hypothetical protein
MKENESGLFNSKAKRTWFSRVAHSGTASDATIIILTSNQLPLHAKKFFSNNEAAGIGESVRKTIRWGDEIITRDNY